MLLKRQELVNTGWSLGNRLTFPNQFNHFVAIVDDLANFCLDFFSHKMLLLQNSVDEQSNV